MSECNCELCSGFAMGPDGPEVAVSADDGAIRRYSVGEHSTVEVNEDSNYQTLRIGDWECMIGEPEDRNWFRDLQPVISKIEAYIKEWEKEQARVSELESIVREIVKEWRDWGENRCAYCLEPIQGSGQCEPHGNGCLYVRAMRAMEKK